MPSAAFPELELLSAVAVACTVSAIYERLRGRFACARCTVWRALQRAEAKTLVVRTAMDCDVWELTPRGQRRLAKVQLARPRCPGCGEESGSRLEPNPSDARNTTLGSPGVGYRAVPQGKLRCLRCRWCAHVWMGAAAEVQIAVRRDRTMQRGSDLFALVMGATS